MNILHIVGGINRIIPFQSDLYTRKHHFVNISLTNSSAIFGPRKFLVKNVAHQSSPPMPCFRKCRNVLPVGIGEVLVVNNAFHASGQTRATVIVENETLIYLMNMVSMGMLHMGS